MSKTYEELSGATGRQSYYRPLRHVAGGFFAGSPPRVFFEDQEFVLADLSRTGLGCILRDEPTLLDLDAVDRRGVLRLMQRGREILRAPARRVRLEQHKGKVSAGFAIDGPGVDLDELRRRNARALALRAADDARADVPVAYKTFCAEVLEFLGGYLGRIDRHLVSIEAQLSEAEKDDIARELEAAAAPAWRALLERGNRLVLPLHEDKKARGELKAFTERTVTRVLLDGAGWARSYYKPLGYPGDFQIMNWIYDGAPQGETIKQKFLHQLSLVGSHAVQTRMLALADIIAGLARARGEPERPYEMISIGAGPARELDRVLKVSDPAQRYRATLVDQEELALEHALAAARALNAGGRLQVEALNISFKEMLNPSPLAGSFSRKDLIYSSGLVDYLNPLLAQRFIHRLYEFLNPGGAIIIGNVNNLPSGMIWSSEYAVDWTLFFRSREEMAAMAGGTPDAKVSIKSDSLEAIYFLVIEKPIA
ncbi:MAG: class I SAM-dependent methyltransferase [Pseudomonadota bacterium]|nr:class I SAM-dependent methyltransferase [Pseudomonadota bacterium]